jgi:hypothetical protein
MNDYSPPDRPVEWLVVHVATGTQRRVVAQTAFFAAQAAGWTLSECTTEQVRK